MLVRSVVTILSSVGVCYGSAETYMHLPMIGDEDYTDGTRPYGMWEALLVCVLFGYFLLMFTIARMIVVNEPPVAYM